jgi:uncharacterized membrane protein required for colicin V production
MNWLDFILIAILVIFTWRYFRLGFIKSLGSLVGLAAGAVIASYTYLKLFGLIKVIFGGFDNIGKVVCFFLLFIILSRLIYFVFAALDKIYNFISIIPFLSSINNLAGAILGALIGLLVCSLVLYVGSRFFAANGLVGEWMIGSRLAPYLLLAAKFLTPIMSIGLKNLKSII